MGFISVWYVPDFRVLFGISRYRRQYSILHAKFYYNNLERIQYSGTTCVPTIT